ncbi:MAG: hypothetical protein VZQ80_08255 [Lachnospiraceae bacterium]|nr:hypothetical protein [Lachnospiraceae bacterium]
MRICENRTLSKYRNISGEIHGHCPHHRNPKNPVFSKKWNILPFFRHPVPAAFSQAIYFKIIMGTLFLKSRNLFPFPAKASFCSTPPWGHFSQKAGICSVFRIYPFLFNATWRHFFQKAGICSVPRIYPFLFNAIMGTLFLKSRKLFPFPAKASFCSTPPWRHSVKKGRKCSQMPHMTRPDPTRINIKLQPVTIRKA